MPLCNVWSRAAKNIGTRALISQPSGFYQILRFVFVVWNVCIRYGSVVTYKYCANIFCSLCKRISSYLYACFKLRNCQQDLSSRDHGINSCQDESSATRKNEDTSNEWKSSGRRSVHEMIKRFQQVPGMHNGWRGPRSGSSEPTSPEHSQCSQNQRVQPQGGVGNSWRGEGKATLHALWIDSRRFNEFFVRSLRN